MGLLDEGTGGIKKNASASPPEARCAAAAQAPPYAACRRSSIRVTSTINRYAISRATRSMQRSEPVVSPGGKPGRVPKRPTASGLHSRPARVSPAARSRNSAECVRRVVLDGGAQNVSPCGVRRTYEAPYRRHGEPSHTQYVTRASSSMKR